MPIIQQKAHESAKYSILSINTPASGGLNIQDLDYTLPLAQSPKMLNMMYKNGVFGKRYGQALFDTLDATILNAVKYKDTIYYQTTLGLYKGDERVYEHAYSERGLFFVFNQELYFLHEDGYMVSEGNAFSAVDTYKPEICINRRPDGTYSDLIENYNRVGAGFKNTFNGDGTSTVYVLTDKELDTTTVEVTVDTTDYTEGTEFTVDRTAGTVTFTTAPPSGQNNVVITAYKTESEYINSILKCKYYEAYGGDNNSRLFLAGNGESTFYYSSVFDASYFPEMNYAKLGSKDDDITGFGKQYNVLIVFKPTELFQISYSYATDSNGDVAVLFNSQPVSAQIGCDVPYSIQYIDNRLTWCSTDWGVCTLCSTNIQDERNVRQVSRNINGGYRESGLLAEDLTNAISADYEGKYFLFVGQKAYVWDYLNAPYTESTRYTADEIAKATAWYVWDSLGTADITSTVILDRVLYFCSGDDVSMFTNALNDYGEAISAFYQTPMFDFQSYESLKTIKKAFFETRGDMPVHVTITYITDEDADGEEDPEDIVVGSRLWNSFRYETFTYTTVNFAKTFARKCSIKKVALFAILLSDDTLDADLTVSGIKLEYTIVKEIK